MKLNKELQFTKAQMEIIIQESIKRRQFGFKGIVEMTLLAMMKAERDLFLEEKLKQVLPSQGRCQRV